MPRFESEPLCDPRSRSHDETRLLYIAKVSRRLVSLSQRWVLKTDSTNESDAVRERLRLCECEDRNLKFHSFITKMLTEREIAGNCQLLQVVEVSLIKSFDG